MADATNVRIDRYQLLERIGIGGMARVYKAKDLNLDRVVAVKILHDHLADDPTFKERFEREAKFVASLNHPNIVQIYDFNTVERDGFPVYYMVMPFIAGRSLKDTLEDAQRRGVKLTSDRILSIMLDLTDALAYAHASGMIHRDVKPANILIDDNGKAVLSDFGIARLVYSRRLTQEGLSTGTPAYMSPEQVSGQAGDARSDLYSLGCIFFELLTGRPPYDDEGGASLMLKHLTAPVPAVSDFVEQPRPQLDAFIHKALAKAPGDRFQTAQDFGRALRLVYTGRGGTGTLNSLPQTGSLNRLPQTGSLNRPPQTGSLNRPAQTGSLKSPPTTGLLSRLPATGALKPPPQTGSVNRPSQTGPLKSLPATGPLEGFPTTGPLRVPTSVALVTPEATSAISGADSTQSAQATSRLTPALAIAGLAALAILAAIVVFSQILRTPAPAPEATATASVVPAANLNKLMFVSTFGDKDPFRADWPQDDVAGFLREITPDGFYHLRSERPSTASTSLFNPDYVYGDVSISMSGALQADGNAAGAFGIVFRFQDQDHYNVFAVDGQGRYSIWVRDDGQWHELRGLPEKWTRDDVVLPRGGKNHLIVEASGSSLTGVINGKEVARVQDNTFTSGNIGIYVATHTTGATDAQVDLFQVFPESSPSMTER